MAGSKKDKQIRQKEVPKGKSIVQGGDPEQYYSQNPAWTFANFCEKVAISVGGFCIIFHLIFILSQKGINHMEQIMVKNLYNLKETIAAPLLETVTYPWEALPKIGAFILELGKTLLEAEYEKKGEDIWIAKSADIAATACINGPAIIGKDAEVRHCAFIRGNAIVGEGAVVGNSTELKNAILFNKVQVPHYNYVGDSILGYKAHMGAGSIASNVKSDKKPVVVVTPNERFETGLKKFGTMLGDEVEVGCGSILNPGSIVGRRSNIYPLSLVRGYIPEESIYKKQGEVVAKE